MACRLGYGDGDLVGIAQIGFIDVGRHPGLAQGRDRVPEGVEKYPNVLKDGGNLFLRGCGAFHPVLGLLYGPAAGLDELEGLAALVFWGAKEGASVALANGRA